MEEAYKLKNLISAWYKYLHQNDVGESNAFTLRTTTFNTLVLFGKAAHESDYKKYLMKLESDIDSIMFNFSEGMNQSRRTGELRGVISVHETNIEQFIMNNRGNLDAWSSSFEQKLFRSSYEIAHQLLWKKTGNAQICPDNIECGNPFKPDEKKQIEKKRGENALKLPEEYYTNNETKTLYDGYVANVCSRHGLKCNIQTINNITSVHINFIPEMY